MIRLAIFSVFMLFCQSQCFAGIFLPALKFPDIFSNNLSSAFNSTSKTFVINGLTDRYNPDSATTYYFQTPSQDSSATTTINAVVGASLGGNLYAATGNIEIKGPGTVTLLQGTLRGLKAGFNYAGTRDSFEFHFYVTGGQLSSQFGNTARTIMFLNGSNTALNFSSDFFHSAGIENKADTNPTVPESSSAAVWLILGCVTMIAGSRKRFPFLASTSVA
jgi:hypothetical protein